MKIGRTLLAASSSDSMIPPFSCYNLPFRDHLFHAA
jgi:hypothetical protein